MDRDEAIRLLKGGEDGIREWNQRRARHEEIPDLTEAVLSDAVLLQADLRGAVLSRAVLNEADLRGADLSWAVLRGAILFQAALSRADLSEAPALSPVTGQPAHG